MPGELEDLGGAAAAPPPAPDPAEIARLRSEVQRRVVELTRSMTTARDLATKLAADASDARARGAEHEDEATQLERRADAERAKMHALLAELATLDAELKELERAGRAAAEAARNAPPDPTPRTSRTSGASASPLDDALDALKRRAAAPAEPRPRPPGKKPVPTTLDDELAALKQKMASAPPKKKP
jgi:septal ring factor EnvC (AmiA/AmiB activator)